MNPNRTRSRGNARNTNTMLMRMLDLSGNELDLIGAAAKRARVPLPEYCKRTLVASARVLAGGASNGAGS